MPFHKWKATCLFNDFFFFFHPSLLECAQLIPAMKACQTHYSCAHFQKDNCNIGFNVLHSESLMSTHKRQKFSSGILKTSLAVLLMCLVFPPWLDGNEFKCQNNLTELLFSEKSCVHSSMTQVCAVRWIVYAPSEYQTTRSPLILSVSHAKY